MEVPPPISRLSYSFFNSVTFNILLMGIFYYIGFFEVFLYFCKGSTHCKTHCGENNCILFSFPAYDVETIKTCSKIDLKIKLPGQDGGHSKKLHEIK